MTLKRLGLWALVGAAGLLGGCRTVALGSDPLTRTPTRPTAELFRVDWWRPLTGSVKLLEFAPREPAAPTVDAERKQVIALTRDGVVRAHGFDGTPRWDYKAKTFFSAGAGVADGRVYVPCGDGELIALDAQTGEKLWSYPTGEELGSAPVQAQGLVLVASHSDSVFAVDAQTGAWKWQYRRDSPSGFTTRGIAQPTIRGDLAYLGFADGTLAALRLKDGAPKWERMLSTSTGPFIDVDTQPAFDAQGNLYAASVRDGVFSLDPETGNPQWKAPLTGVTHLMVRDDLLFSTGAGKINALTAADGKTLWSLPLGEDAAGAPVIAGGLLVVPLGSALLFVDPALGQGRAALGSGAGGHRTRGPRRSGATSSSSPTWASCTRSIWWGRGVDRGPPARPGGGRPRRASRRGRPLPLPAAAAGRSPRRSLGVPRRQGGTGRVRARGPGARGAGGAGRHPGDRPPALGGRPRLPGPGGRAGAPCRADPGGCSPAARCAGPGLAHAGRHAGARVLRGGRAPAGRPRRGRVPTR